MLRNWTHKTEENSTRGRLASFLLPFLGQRRSQGEAAFNIRDKATGEEEKKRVNETWESIYRISNDKNTNYEKESLLGILNLGLFTTILYTRRVRSQE